MASELGPLPRLQEERQTTAAGDPNHRAAAHGKAAAIVSSAFILVPSIMATSRNRIVVPRKTRPGRGIVARESMIAQCADHVVAATRHHWPSSWIGDTIRLDPESRWLKFKTWPAGRLLQDHHQTGVAGGLSRARLTAKARIAEIEPYSFGHARSSNAPGLNVSTLKAKGFNR